MLKTLTVSNFALIDHVQIAFAPGLNILTGETGAGKSILIDALGAVLGERASVESIRRGCDYFRVEAVFDIDDAKQMLLNVLDEQGIPCDEDSLIISRRLNRSGKNTVTVNGCQVTLAVLRQIGEMLVDMHGQHENQALLRPQSHLLLVDQFALNVESLLTEYKTVYGHWRHLQAEITDYDARSRERERRIEMLTWQIEEIEKAALSAGEDEQCQQEIHVLANVEKIAHAVSASYLLLKQGERGFAVLSALAEIRRELESAARYDGSLKLSAQNLSECYYQLEDIADGLRHYSDGLDSDPARLRRLEDRLDTIHTLKKKYGSTIEEILTYHRQACLELESLQNASQSAEQLSAREKEFRDQLVCLADSLDTKRRKAAAEMEEAVSRQLQDLGMPNAVFRIAVNLTEAFQLTGRNEVICLFSANRGEEPKPLQKVASGGELSRIALALKSVTAKKDLVGTVIFDEVDSGIGGQTAQMVAEKIAYVASAKQVLCITHSPPIASMADIHLRAEKIVDSERTITLIRELSPAERILELARMVAGDNSSAIAVENAKHMMEIAMQKKEKWTNKA